jgi:hypothetical protein
MARVCGAGGQGRGAAGLHHLTASVMRLAASGL